MPFLAIFRHDLRTVGSNWLVRFWFGGCVLLTMFLLLMNWERFETAPLIASTLLPYLVFPWFLIVMVLGITPLSGTRAEALSDSILSRPVNRCEYLLAIWCSRVSVVLGVFLVVMVPAALIAACAERAEFENTVTFYGATATLALVGIVLVLQVSLAFLLGTFMRSSLLSIVILLVCWYPINGVLSMFQLEEFSPIALSRALPTLLESEWKSSEDAEVEDEEDLREAGEQLMRTIGSVWGGSSDPQPPAKKKEVFYDKEAFKDFSLPRVILGYGIPAVLCLGISLIAFSVRDV
jgi:hypothetical protein